MNSSQVRAPVTTAALAGCQPTAATASQLAAAAARTRIARRTAVCRVIQRVIEDPLSEELLRLKHGPGDQVVVEVADNEVKMRLVPKGGRPKKEKVPEPPPAPAAAGSGTTPSAAE